MSSPALSDLLLGVREVKALRGFPPHTPVRSSQHSRQDARIAHRRACVVLLSSHFERYIYGLNESAVDFLNTARLQSSAVPLTLRLLQIRGAIDRLAETAWQNREDHLIKLFDQFSTHWDSSQTIAGLEAGANLEWMKSPQVGDVKRYFGYFEIGNIVRSVTRSEATRRAMERHLQALVDARNGIAHGDQTIQPTATDIAEYLKAVEAFCIRADKAMARSLGVLASTTPPW